MKILYAASTARHILDFHMDVLSGLKSAGFEVCVVCRDAYALAEAFCAAEIPFAKSFVSTRNIRAFFALRRLIKNERFDIVSTHTALAGFVVRMAVMLSTAKDKRPFCVHTAHGYLFGRSAALSGKLTYPFERICAPVTDMILTMNAEDYACAKKLIKPAGRVAEIPGMGVDMVRYRPPERGEKDKLRRDLCLPADFLIFCAAEFSVRKNHKTLIKAIAGILRTIPDVTLLLAGDGALAEKTLRLANKLEVAGSVRFLGYVPDTSPYLKASDMAVSASLSEGLPLGIIEALACGLPVAASRVKGHIELLPEEFLFDPRNPHEAALRFEEAVQKQINPDSKGNNLRREVCSKTKAAGIIIKLYNNIEEERRAERE